MSSVKISDVGWYLLSTTVLKDDTGSYRYMQE